MIATTRDTFNLHPGGMIFGADIALARILEVERLPQALAQALERWLTPDQLTSTTVGESLLHDVPSQFWEWQALITVHDIGIFVPASEESQPIWINADMYWHDSLFSESCVEAIFLPDLAENQALASMTVGNPPERTVAIFVSVNSENIIEAAYGISANSESHLQEINLSNLLRHRLVKSEEMALFDDSLIQQALNNCQITLDGNK